MKPDKKNSEEAKVMSLDLQQGSEAEQKVDYYKSILKAYDDLVISIDAKISSLDGLGTLSPEDTYQRSKLVVEKVETQNNINNKKKFFEMWLERKLDYDKKFAMLTAECNEKFPEVEAKARELAQKDVKLASYMNKYAQEENPSQKVKNEYYLLLKHEVIRRVGNGTFAPKEAATV